VSKHPSRRLTRVVAYAVVAVSGLVAGLAAPAAGHPGQPSSVFDPNMVSWTSYRNYSPAAFDDIVAEQEDAGRIPIDIDADTSGGSYVLGGVFQSNLDSRPWQLLHGLTVAELDAAINRDVNFLRLVDVETFVVGGTRRYAALWVAANFPPFGWDFRRSITGAQLDSFAASERAAGRMPLDIDEYQVGNEMRYDVITGGNTENLDWRLVRDLTGDQFHNVYLNLRGTHRPLVADSTPSPNGQRFSGIWVRNANGRDWVIRRNLTVDEWAETWQEQFDAGNRVINFERYQTSSGTLFLGIWRQNS
jgi:Bacterial tandem repeat domain 1